MITFIFLALITFQIPNFQAIVNNSTKIAEDSTITPDDTASSTTKEDIETTPSILETTTAIANYSTKIAENSTSISNDIASSTTKEDIETTPSILETTTAITCPRLHYPTNGMIRCGNGNYWRSTCKFKCNEGFILSPRENNCFSCLANKSWISASGSGEVPTCVIAGCYPKQSNPVNGKVTCTDKNYVGSKCSFECLNGYEIDGSSSIVCTDTIQQFHAWSGSSPRCKDINECQQEKCGTNERCENNPGSYRCVCLDGYQRQNEICRDINECQQQTCGTNERCENNPGSYQCLCIAGYQKQNGICRDINECQQQICGTNERCENNPGSYRCVCLDGYQRQIGICRDINECQQEKCGTNERCENNPGSYHCLCIAGYQRQNGICRENNRGNWGRNGGRW